MCDPAGLNATETAVLDPIRHDVEVAGIHDLARVFVTMIQERRADELDAWLEASEATGVRALAAFARGIRQDHPAVCAALELPWSNGQAEGQINRLKTLKRQMYGRAGFELMRARVLHAA